MFVCWASFLYIIYTHKQQHPQTCRQDSQGFYSGSTTVCIAESFLPSKTHMSMMPTSPDMLWVKHCFVLWTLSENCLITRTFITFLFILPRNTPAGSFFIKEHVFQGSSSIGCPHQREQIFFTELLTWRIWPCEKTRLPVAQTCCERLCGVLVAIAMPTQGTTPVYIFGPSDFSLLWSDTDCKTLLKKMCKKECSVFTKCLLMVYKECCVFTKRLLMVYNNKGVIMGRVSFCGYYGVWGGVWRGSMTQWC